MLDKMEEPNLISDLWIAGFLSEITESVDSYCDRSHLKQRLYDLDFFNSVSNFGEIKLISIVTLQKYSDNLLR